MVLKLRYVVFLLIVATACRQRLSPEQQRAEFIKQGDALMAKGDHVGAATAYGQAAQHGSPDGPLMLKGATANMLAGKFRVALTPAVQAAELMPDNVDAQLLAARLMLTQRQFNDVKHRMAAILQRHPNSIEALIELGHARAHLQNRAAALLGFSVARTKDEFDGMALQARFPSGPRQPGITANDLDAAEQAFKSAVNVDPHHPKAQLALANFLWWAGRADEAESALKSVADEHPEERTATLALGAYYRLVHRPTEAEHYLKLAAQNDPRAPETLTAVSGPRTRETGPDAGRTAARFTLVDLYLETKRDEEALALLNALSATYPVDTGLKLARVEFQTGKRDEAIRRVDGLLKRDPPARGASLLKAQFLLEKGDVAEAVSLARAAAAADPVSSDARATLGQALLASGDLENAYDEHAEALRLQPRAAGSAMALMHVSLALKRKNDALEHARTAVQLNPDNREAALGSVKAMVLAGDYNGAERALQPMLARDPASAEVLAELGAVHAARGNNDDAARAAFTRALQAMPDSLESVTGLVSLDLKEKRPAAARQRAEAALARHPRDPRYLEVAARAYAADNDAARAEGALRKVLELDRANVGVALSLSGAIATRHPEEAAQMLQQAIERRPRSVAARDGLAGILERMGRNADARKEYEKISELSYQNTSPEMTAFRSKAASRIAVLDGQP